METILELRPSQLQSQRQQNALSSSSSKSRENSNIKEEVNSPKTNTEEDKTTPNTNQSSCNLRLIYGNILQYKGDAIINAANEGCIGGFGLDEQVNKVGGFELKNARRDLNGCPTGNAKITPSFGHSEYVPWIIHAVGPVYRMNKFKVKNDAGYAASIDKNEYFRSLDSKLVSAYRGSLQRAREVGARLLAFPLLSAGVFRGDRSLGDVVEIGVTTLVDSIINDDDNSFDEVCLFAYTKEERELLGKVVERVQKHLELHDDFCGYSALGDLF